MADGQLRRGVAVVIGVGAYRHPGVAPLGCAVADAEAVAAALADPAVCGFPPAHVRLLADAGAGRTAVVEALTGWLPRHAAGADLVVLYFAGHGTVRRHGGRDEGYLLPHDADPDNPAAHGVPMRDLSAWVDELGAGAAVIVLDCCHAGQALARREVAGRDLSAVAPAALEGLAGRGRFLLAACAAGEVWVEGHHGHGLFTFHGLEAVAALFRRADSRYELRAALGRGLTTDAYLLATAPKPATAAREPVSWAGW